MHSVGQKRPISVFWITLVLFAILIVALPFPIRATVPVERVFRVEASRFAYSPATLKVNPGDQITIELVSTDVVHGLAIDGHGNEVIADPGQTAKMSFVAERSGSFRWRCSTTCGALHPFMVGRLQVGQNSLLWRGIGLSLVAVAAGLWRNRR